MWCHLAHLAPDVSHQCVAPWLEAVPVPVLGPWAAGLLGGRGVSFSQGPKLPQRLQGRSCVCVCVCVARLSFLITTHSRMGMHSGNFSRDRGCLWRL